MTSSAVKALDAHPGFGSFTVTAEQIDAATGRTVDLFTPDTIDRSTARELLTRVALGYDSLTAALAQLRRPAP